MTWGLGDSKLAINDNGKITYFKETNAITKLGTTGGYSGNEKNIVFYQGAYYLVGKSALQYPDATVMNVMDYESMKTITPLIALKYLGGEIPSAANGLTAQKITEDFDYVAFTLSSAFRQYSRDYHEFISSALGIPTEKVKIVPQGASCKITLDHIGLDLTNPSLKDSFKNYLIIDIGFNTIDVSNVIDGSLMPEDIKGYPLEGVVNIANHVQQHVKSDLNQEFSIPRIRTALYDKQIKVRDKVYDLTKYIEDASLDYLKHLQQFLEQNYGDRMNTIDNVILFGGGAELIKVHKDAWKEMYGEGFMQFPVTGSEFYNAVGGLYL